MARSVADAVAARRDVGADPRDALSATGSAHRRDFARYLDAGALKGVRIGVVRKFAGFNRDVDAAGAEHCGGKSAGAIVVDPWYCRTLASTTTG
jgi:amidase